MNNRSPSLPILALVDFDPDGVSILHCYRHGSEKMNHEADACTPAIHWLGIKSGHLLYAQKGAAGGNADNNTNQNSQGSMSSAKSSIASTTCQDPTTYLTQRDRSVAVRNLFKIVDAKLNNSEEAEIYRELQVMLMLGIKAEIEWLDESGDLCWWLDKEIGSALATCA